MGSIFSKYKFRSSPNDKSCSSDPRASSSSSSSASTLEDMKTGPSSSSKPQPISSVDKRRSKKKTKKDSQPRRVPPPDSSSTSRKSEEGKNTAKRSDSNEHLRLGSITETWKNPTQWQKFKAYLRTLDEGRDSDMIPMSLERYATFLELYSRLDRAERRNDAEECLKLIRHIRWHPEDFFGRERCLKCIDSGMRSSIFDNVKRVLDEEEDERVRPGLWVFQPAYPRVLEKLNSLVGTFHDPNVINARE